MKKNGFTLVELLVGLVIAMLCMIMMLMLFKQISQVSLEASFDAEYDTQVQIGMLILQKVIQNAGYGSGNTNDIAMDASKDILYLRFTPDITTPTLLKCQAILSNNDIENKEYRLYLLENIKNCGTDADLKTSSIWNSTHTTRSPLITIKNKNIEATTAPVFSFKVENLTGGKKCTPYGISKDNPSGSKYVTVTAKGQHSSVKQIRSSICLNNI